MPCEGFKPTASVSEQPISVIWSHSKMGFKGFTNVTTKTFYVYTIYRTASLISDILAENSKQSVTLHVQAFSTSALDAWE